MTDYSFAGNVGLLLLGLLDSRPFADERPVGFLVSLKEIELFKQRSREDDNALVEKEDRLSSSSDRCNNFWQDSAATDSADSILLTESQPRYLKVVQLKAGSGCITFMRDLLPHDNFSDSHFVTSEESASHESSGPFSSLDLQKKRNVNSFNILSLLDRSGGATEYLVSGCKILTSYSALPGRGRGVAGNFLVVVGRGSYRVLLEEEKNVDIPLLHFVMAGLASFNHFLQF
ncbi:hypothetical protein EV421DRAFT_1742987 [Armillaria borealis]|uniref:Uncharacterized protein n=1 Tax=Armillaria borealis TaxID=47425 RepID=A0AA39IZ57_9AGAR|nr:hypothetical protein EV421DRAFT_1742987 [Armillaria borealis]